MAKFRFTAISPDGTTIDGVEDALTITTARRALIERDLAPIEVREKKNFFQIEVTKKKVPRKELMHFARQMGVFMRAGIPVLEALDVMTEEMGNKVFQRILAEMSDALRSGETFADAAEAHPEAFPPFFLGILRSAELTGSLDTVLDQLAEYIDRDMEARRKITSALVYPGIVIVMAIVAVIVITGFVLPRFEVFFASLNAKLPLPTRMLLAIAHFFVQRWYVFVGVLAAVVGAMVLSVTTHRGREVRDHFLLHFPVLGDLVSTAILERFCRILCSMVGAGVPLPEALQVTSNATNNIVFRKGLTNAREAMMRGQGLAAPLSDTGLFPAAARHMFSVGERTGTMDEQLETAASYFDRELEYKLKSFTALFEPAVIIIVGLIVGFVAIALISAMYGIFRQVQV